VQVCNKATDQNMIADYFSLVNRKYPTHLIYAVINCLNFECSNHGSVIRLSVVAVKKIACNESWQ